LKSRRILPRPVLLVLLCLAVQGTAMMTTPTIAATPTPSASQAGLSYLTEHGRLEFIREVGSALYERGNATGTYNVPMTTLLTRYPNYVTAIVTIYPHGGSISGTSKANYIVKNETGYFGGTLTINHGTGSYRGVAGKNLGISGTINRNTYNMTVNAHGDISR
jgi:hypothetical protein